MSKDASPPPKAPKAPATEGEPLPPLFWDASDEEPKTLKAPIYMVWVSTKDKAGETVPLDCCPLSALPEFPHQLAEKYPGVPFVELVARSDTGFTVAKVVHRCRMTTPAAPHSAPAGAPPASAGFEAFGMMQAMNERTDKLMALLISSKDAASAQIVEAISKMSGQRIVDSQDLYGALARMKQGAGGGEGKGELAAFLKGFGHAQSLIAAGQEGEEGEGGESLESLLSVALKEFIRAKGTAPEPGQPRPRPRAVPDPEGG